MITQKTCPNCGGSVYFGRCRLDHIQWDCGDWSLRIVFYMTLAASIVQH